MDRRTDNSDGISQQVTTRHLVKATQVGKAGGTNLATVRTLAAVTDQENTHLSLGSLNGRVGLTRGNGVTLGEKQEVMDQSLHVLLHGSTGRGHDLIVLDTNGTSGHLVQALLDNSERLAELLHAAQVTVVAVTVDTNGDIKLDLVVGIIGLGLPDIPGNTGATEHDTGETHVESISSVDDTDTLGSGLPDTVIRKQLLSLINTVTELRSPLVNII